MLFKKLLIHWESYPEKKLKEKKLPPGLMLVVLLDAKLLKLG